MKALLAVIPAIAMLAMPAPADAQAAGLGSARSSGVQRAIAPPAQKVASAPAPQAASSSAPAAQAAPGNRWLAPLAGLAAGLGLGWFSQAGLAPVLAAVALALLGVAVVFSLVRRITRARDERTPMQYAALGPEPLEPAPPPPAPPEAAAPRPAAPLPAGFDAPAFLRQARLNFIRLQEANDRHDLEALKAVTTDAMFAAILAELAPSENVEHTDVVSLDASLVGVVTEGDTHRASVRFRGSFSEGGAPAAPFDEVWQLEKPVSGASGWLLAGIQQVS